LDHQFVINIEYAHTDLFNYDTSQNIILS